MLNQTSALQPGGLYRLCVELNGTAGKLLEPRVHASPLTYGEAAPRLVTHVDADKLPAPCELCDGAFTVGYLAAGMRENGTVAPPPATHET